MKVFISWSGQRSRELAMILKDWLPCVIQSCEPWISTHDMDSGEQWFNKIMSELTDTTFGIFCLTPDNLEKPWIQFEAGAIASKGDVARVCTLTLGGLTNTSIPYPLQSFNATPPTYDGFKSLFFQINLRTSKPLAEKVFDTTFDTFFQKFGKQFLELNENYQPASEKEPMSKENTVLDEILKTVRGLDKQINHLVQQKETSSNSNENYEHFVADEIRRKEEKSKTDAFIIQTRINLVSAAVVKFIESELPEKPTTFHQLVELVRDNEIYKKLSGVEDQVQVLLKVANYFGL